MIGKLGTFIIGTSRPVLVQIIYSRTHAPYFLLCRENYIDSYIDRLVNSYLDKKVLKIFRYVDYLIYLILGFNTEWDAFTSSVMETSPCGIIFANYKREKKTLRCAH